MTGFNGAVRRASADTTNPISDKTVVVRFDTNVNGIDWSFRTGAGQPEGPFRREQARLLPRHQPQRQAPDRPGALQRPAGSRRPRFLEAGVFLLQEPDPGPGQSAEFPCGLHRRPPLRRGSRHPRPDRDHPLRHPPPRTPGAPGGGGRWKRCGPAAHRSRLLPPPPPLIPAKAGTQRFPAGRSSLSLRRQSARIAFR